jgi:ABC-type multidrug transport system fused ATPase/permease subunit
VDTLDRRRLGDLLTRLGGDVAAIESFVLSGVATAFAAVLQIVFFVGALFYARQRRPGRPVDQSRGRGAHGIVGARRACTVSLISPLGENHPACRRAASDGGQGSLLTALAMDVVTRAGLQT